MRLAHLSDLHAFSLENTGLLPFFGKRLAGMVNLRLHRKEKHPRVILEALFDDLNEQQLDEIAITGDLTNLALESEFRLARRLLDRLDIGSRHVTIVPGNHDVYTVDALLRRPFHSHLSPYATSDSGDDTFPFVRVREPIALIGLSTARPSPVPFASGSLGRRQLMRLEERLDELGRRGLFRIVLLHHPPVANRHSILRGLRDRAEFAKVLARVGAELVLHGHEHRDLDDRLDGPNGPIPVSGVGSATYADPRPDRRARYHIYDLAPSLHAPARIVTRKVRAYDPTTGRFAELYSPPDSNDQPSAPQTAFLASAAGHKIS
ncbi:MAG: metallophosphoesterase [Polyangia bacterium]